LIEDKNLIADIGMVSGKNVVRVGENRNVYTVLGEKHERTRAF
jgi:hypothetical protein